MNVPILKLMIALFLFITSLFVKAQNYYIVQGINTEKYQGKKFLLKVKVFYVDALSKDFMVVPIAGTGENKIQNTIHYDDSTWANYKENDWTELELSGKINPKDNLMFAGIQAVGKGSFYLDDFKLFIIDNKQEIEIPLKNADFENETFSDWQINNKEPNTKITLSPEKHSSGKQSLFVDNREVKVKPKFGSNQEVGKYMDVNGVKLYYETYGQGEPMLLLHGNNESMVTFYNQLDLLSKKYTVIALDSRGQGRSTSNDNKLTYELIAEDVNTFLDKLNLKNVNILGWSDGGNIAIILGITHPDKIKKMAIMGANLYNDETSVIPEINPILLQQIKEMEDRGLPKTDMNYRLKMLLLTEPHVNPDSLKSIKAKTLVMAGEHDVITENHTKLIAEKIPNSDLVIFKDGDHEAPAKMPEIFNKTILDFFEK